MKKILFAIASVAMLVSCGGHDKFYFDEAENRAYNNPEAEFDSLSYAFGLEMAMPLYTQLSDFNFNSDYFVELAEEYLSMNPQSFPDMEIVNTQFSEFDKECMRPYMTAKQRRLHLNDETPLPEIYNEKYDSLMFTKWMAIMATNMVITPSVPVNIHYVVEGIKDSKELFANAAGTYSILQLDSLTQAKIASMRSHIQKYYRAELPKYHIERSMAWLSNVAKQRDVKPYVIGNDTIYYRINSAGGVKSSAPTDSVALDYQIYTYRGKLVQSTDSQVKALKKRIEEIESNDKLTDSMRVAQVRQTEDLIVKVKNHIAPVNTIRMDIIKHCLSLVGEFGSITVWAPGKYAPMSRDMMPNESIVINLDVKRIAKGVDVATVAKKQIQSAKPAEGKPAPIKVVPAKRVEKK